MFIEGKSLHCMMGFSSEGNRNGNFCIVSSASDVSQSTLAKLLL
ncbi:hypothetical protein X975_02445, partial [Stegodyphus mimosarum]